MPGVAVYSAAPVSPARRRLATVGLVVGAVAATLLVLELAFRLAGVSVGTVQINRGTVRRSFNPRLAFELRRGPSFVPRSTTGSTPEGSATRRCR